MNLPFPIPFTKMSGTGNDFILIDHRQPFLHGADCSTFARAVCRRNFSVGADGLILIENSQTAHFAWKFFNADGSVAEMCGNGARCAARYAYTHGIAPAAMRFETMAGIIEAEVIDGAVRIRLTPPGDIRLDLSLDIDAADRTLHFVNTGVPHTVLFVEDNERTPVTKWGRFIRNHKMFQPAGTNANFVEITGENALFVRTYERGVENETMACGTGATAAALVAAFLGRVRPPVSVTTSGKDILIIHFTLTAEKNVEKLFLEGPAGIIYHGELQSDAIGVSSS